MRLTLALPHTCCSLQFNYCWVGNGQFIENVYFFLDWAFNMAVALSTSDLDFDYPDSAPETAKGPGPGDPFDPDPDSDNTMDKIACIEEMINRMEDIPSPSEVFLQGVLSEVKRDDVYHMVNAQKHM